MHMHAGTYFLTVTQFSPAGLNWVDEDPFSGRIQRFSHSVYHVQYHYFCPERPG